MKPPVKQLHTYSYGGPVYRFDRLYSKYWEGETQAVSPEKALSNLTFKAKKYFNFNYAAKLELDPSYLLCDDESFEDEITQNRKIERCPKCGTRLTDGGYCPECDDGEENAYPVEESYPRPKKLYSIKDKKAIWDDDAQDFIWWDSEAKHNDKYATCYKAKLSPKDFLDLTTSKGAANLKVGDALGFGKLKELDIDEFNKETYQPCFLIISFENDHGTLRRHDFGRKEFEAKVVGHEGRHRMFALMHAGVEEVDVQIKVTGKYYDKYSPYEINKLNLIGQFNDNVKVTINNPIIMSYEEHKRVNPALNAEHKDLNENGAPRKVAFHGREMSEKEFVEYTLSLISDALPTKNLTDNDLNNWGYSKGDIGGLVDALIANGTPSNQINLTDSSAVDAPGGSEIDGLKEDIEKHDELNPKLWNENGTLKEEVREKILQIANEFIDNLKEDGIKFDLKDIRLVGSNCSYNYTKDSDLDVHLIADASSLTCPDNLYPLLYSSYRSLFNKNLDIDFYGIPVEIYVEVE